MPPFDSHAASAGHYMDLIFWPPATSGWNLFGLLSSSHWAAGTTNDRGQHRNVSLKTQRRSKHLPALVPRCGSGPGGTSGSQSRGREGKARPPRDYNSQQPPRRRGLAACRAPAAEGAGLPWAPRALNHSVLVGKEIPVLHGARSSLLCIMPPYWEGFPLNFLCYFLTHLPQCFFYPGHWKEGSKGFI